MGSVTPWGGGGGAGDGHQGVSCCCASRRRRGLEAVAPIGISLRAVAQLGASIVVEATRAHAGGMSRGLECNLLVLLCMAPLAYFHGRLGTL